MEEKTEGRTVGRNEPCPCGSGKKYKRCCGVGAAPKLGAPSKGAAMSPDQAAAMGGMPDLSKMDPAKLAKFSQALQRLPRGQMQKLQAIMQKAMHGKDVSREAAELERSLPPDVHELFKSFGQELGPMMGGMGGAGDAAAPAEATAAGSDEMTEEEAKKIVEKAVREGKIDSSAAQELLEHRTEEKSSRFGKLWKGLTGKGTGG